MANDLISPQESMEIAKACEILRMLPGVVSVGIELNVSSDNVGSVRKRVEVKFAQDGEPVKAKTSNHVDEFCVDSASLEAGLKQAAEAARRFGAAKTPEWNTSDWLGRLAKVAYTNPIAQHFFSAWKHGQISFPDCFMGIIEALDEHNKSLMDEAVKASERTSPDAQIWAENKRQLTACIAAGATAPKAVIGEPAKHGKSSIAAALPIFRRAEQMQRAILAAAEMQACAKLTDDEVGMTCLRCGRHLEQLAGFCPECKAGFKVCQEAAREQVANADAAGPQPDSYDPSKPRGGMF